MDHDSDAPTLGELSDLSDLPEITAIEEPNPNYLSAKDLDLVFFIERYHATIGEAPSDKDVKLRFADLDQAHLDQFKKNPLVLKSMEARGIPYPAAADRFTDRQMAAAATMTDIEDRRSNGKRLLDLGITTREWSTWMLDDNFANYVLSRSERMLKNSQHLAHLGLIKGARNGNVNSIKYMNEMTGYYDPARDAQLNVQFILHQFIEIVQRHVKDPLTIHKMATEMSNLASRSSGNSNSSRTINAVALKELK